MTQCLTFPIDQELSVSLSWIFNTLNHFMIYDRLHPHQTNASFRQLQAEAIANPAHK
ncbi:hypothetical protein PMG71_13260 [Roseofilum sp. BLCC_M154]|uniref:Transposase n=1 Tax=Roseofilum acuticapitatum BLCC-M154 TaxID=3022444 RepID=A0ABT7AU19_9CYAN|nr:hypothetical protein [Roseofilum acuticapitatum]MDJ1170401.1 hypothetical protein [Roseofilum acuticapitatum BLCC-M154]